MKAIGVVILVLLAAYVADQQFAQGKYTAAAQRMVTQIRQEFKTASVGGFFVLPPTLMRCERRTKAEL